MSRTLRRYGAEQVRRFSDTTIAYYDRFAGAFWNGTRDHDVSQNYAAFLDAIEGSSPTSSPAVRYWNMARQRYYRPSARCCRALCVSADRAARPGLDTAENRGFST